MKVDVSIIIPCYNGVSTLDEAGSSIYDQHLNIPFEVIIVDDGSDDGSRDLIVRLAETYVEVDYYFHEYNLGGGAARNTAVKNSQGDLIFCLDSDDILPHRMLQKMIDYLCFSKSDGVVIGKSIFFSGTVENIINTVEYEEKVLSFSDLFSTKSVSVVGNFLYKRTVFDAVGGYPTLHGFDTQGYGFRVLANGFRVTVCKEAFYYQRIPPVKSYYVREFDAGNISKNWFLILADNLYKLTDDIKSLIVEYDCLEYRNNTATSNLFHEVIKHKELLDPEREGMSYEDARNILRSSDNKFDVFWLALDSINSGDLSLAVTYFKKAQGCGFSHWSLYYFIFNVMRYKEDCGEVVDVLKRVTCKDRSYYYYFRVFILRLNNKLSRIVGLK